MHFFFVIEKEHPKAANSLPILANLSRIHFHTLHFHASCIASDKFSDDPEEVRHWYNIANGLATAAMLNPQIACGKLSSVTAKGSKNEDVEWKDPSQIFVPEENVNILFPRHFQIHGSDR